MRYSEEELIQDLKRAESGDDMNRIRKKCIGVLEWGEMSVEAKKLYAETQSRIHPCPEEYKKNPQIHYDISHFCRDGEK